MEVDQNKFARIIQQNNDRLRHLCRVYANNTADENDLYQEILLQLWRSIPGFKEESSLATWIYRVAVNVSVSFIRKKKTRQKYHAAYLKEVKMEQEHRDGQNIMAEQNPEAGRLYEAISTLNEAEKAIITMYLEDFSYADIASVTGITENYVGVKLNRIKKKLTKRIGKKDGT